MVSNAQNEQKLELYVESGHSASVGSISFSPDGKYLASGSKDTTVKLWDAASGSELKTFSGHTANISKIIFSPDGKHLISAGSSDATIRIWEINSSKNRILKEKTAWNMSDKEFNNKDDLEYYESVTDIAVSLDGKYIISSNYKSIKVWDFDSGKLISTHIIHTDWIRSILFTSECKQIVSMSNDKTIKISDLKTGVVNKIFEDKSLIENDNNYRSIALSPDGKYLASGDGNVITATPSYLKIWDIENQKKISEFRSDSNSLTYLPDGHTLVSGEINGNIKLWNLKNGESKILAGHKSEVLEVAFSTKNNLLASSSDDKTIRLWDIQNQTSKKMLGGKTSQLSSVNFAHRNPYLAVGFNDSILQFWNLEKAGTRTLDSRSERRSSSGLVGLAEDFNNFQYGGRFEIAFSPDDSRLLTGNKDINIWETKTGTLLKTIRTDDAFVNSFAFSPNGQKFASNSIPSDKIIIWETNSGNKLGECIGHQSIVDKIAFSPDGVSIVSYSRDKTIKVWDAENCLERKSLAKGVEQISNIVFSKEGKKVICFFVDGIVKVWDLVSFDELLTLSVKDDNWFDKLLKIVPEAKSDDFTIFDRIYDLKGDSKGTLYIFEKKSKTPILNLFRLDKDWLVTTPDGRFDTNKSLDRIEGLHWVINDENFNPLPLDVFARQYYEPNLFQRTLKCRKENTCEIEFKALPSIAEINRVQPKVAIKEIKSNSIVADAVDIMIEVENVTEEVSLSAADKNLKKKLSAGAFDLRLFRDGQLVGTSANKADLEEYIKSAPQLVEKDKASKTLINTEEDKAWRRANDVFALKTDNVRFVSPTKAEYTFRNVKLPENGSKETEFTAYAFNSDRVKSATTEPFNFTIPEAISKSPKKGRAFLISIGVNASENAAYDLRYAANDARKMQEIVGARLKADISKYSEIIQIPLISDYGKDESLSENNARKSIIKGVFSILAGNEKEVSGDVLEQIPDYEKLKTIEPEDTLILTFSGHGYTDQTGVFYLLPYDIGKETTRLIPEVLQKTISSDELSLWMQNITASEMIMIIDACYSSAAVQGEGFKPGPMGSRGLGQLAYDKDMKILSATQANNVAVETGSLQHGLLSYALLQDGINRSEADTDKDKKLLSTEWLMFAEKRVPELYQAVKDGKLNLIVDGKPVTGEKGIELAGNKTKKNNLNLQEPTLFDFKRRNISNILFSLL